MNPVVLIPARMASSRLPGKPLADIAGVPMIVRVWQQARAAAIGPGVVAAAEAEIVRAIGQAGGHARLTGPGLPSGSARALQAPMAFDPAGYPALAVNLPGDRPPLGTPRCRDHRSGRFRHSECGEAGGGVGPG